MNTAVYWLRNDLRLHDNVIFNSKLNSFNRLIPVYVLDSRFKEKHILGFERLGDLRKRFLAETLIDLRKNLNLYNSDLIVRCGDPAKIISEIASKTDADIVIATKEHTFEEINAEESVKNSLDQVPVRFFEQLTLFHPNHLPFQISDLPDIFTDFRKYVEQAAKVRSPFGFPKELPPLPDIYIENEIGEIYNILNSSLKTDLRSSFTSTGGESQGLKRLNDFIWERRLIATYKNTRNGLLGESYSSKLSPWLALGALSPRKIYHEIKKFERKEISNISTYWLIFELIWRDYFRFVAMKYGNKIFLERGIKDANPYLKKDIGTFYKWTNGATGNDFIDANMLELKLTGFMSNRGRQNVASYLVHDLNIDWTWGAAYFESKLIDYDVCSNWGNWMYIAGVGNDPRPNRKFNTKFQAKKYDPEGKYRELWLSPHLMLN